MNLKKLGIIKSFEYDHSKDSIEKFEKANNHNYFIIIAINEKKKNIYQFKKFIYNRNSPNDFSKY